MLAGRRHTWAKTRTREGYREVARRLGSVFHLVAKRLGVSPLNRAAGNILYNSRNGPPVLRHFSERTFAGAPRAPKESLLETLCVALESRFF